MKEFKKRIIANIKATIAYKIETVKTEIKNAKESREADTKSSMGDKYETAGAMLDIEIQKNSKQLALLQLQEKELNQIQVDKKYNTMEFGSLAKINNNYYFMAIGLGKIEVDTIPVFVVSPSSPIGNVLLQGKTSDTVTFNNQNLNITEIW